LLPASGIEDRARDFACPIPGEHQAGGEAAVDVEFVV